MLVGLRRGDRLTAVARSLRDALVLTWVGLAPRLVSSSARATQAEAAWKVTSVEQGITDGIFGF
jgi:hypothetical protein